MRQTQFLVVRRPWVTYPLVVGLRLEPGWARDVLPGPIGGKVVMVQDASLPEDLRASVVEEISSVASAGTEVVPLTGGEGAKSLERVRDLYEHFRCAGLHRDGMVVAVGGGSVSDVVGFAAATWHRGTPWMVLPTTLMAQVDAAIGGKVGVNLHGLKNQVGAFHQPTAVVMDVSWLASLPESSFRSGMAEVVKYALGFDAYLWDLLQRHSGPLEATEGELVLRVVRRCVAIKARLVAFDEEDRGARRLLNLGHTFAHMLEASGVCPDHGTAVGLGLVASTRLGVRLGVCPRDLEQDLVCLLATLGLPHRVTGRVKQPWEAWEADKKHGRSTLVVVPRGVGSCTLVNDPPRDAVWEAYASLFAP